MVLNNSSSIRFRSRHCSSLVFWAIALVAALSSRQQLVAATEETTTEASNRGVHGSSWSHDNGNTTKASENISPAPTNVTAAPANITNITLAPTPVDCESLHFDCYSCIQNGCFWCPTDGLCFETAEYVSREPNKDLIWPERFHNCKIPESFTQTTCTAPGNHFSDPLYSAQNWIFANVKVVPVWEKGYYGKGIRVRINDQGIETTHPEFFGRIDLNTSCPNGTAASLDSSHGMTVASIVGAAANNSDCGVGIAPQVTLSSCILGTMEREEMLTYKLDSFDISQNSWAYEGCGRNSYQQLNCDNPDDCLRKRRKLQNECIFKHKPFEGYLLSPCVQCNFTNPYELGEECITSISNHCQYYPTKDRKACLEYLDLILLRANPSSEGECHFGIMPEESIDAFTKGITEGRDGKGIIYIFAAGNEFAYGDDTNFQGFGANTRFTIPVAALGKPGNISSYSTPGASVFVSAPGGDYKQSVTPIVAATNGGRCDGMPDGTSFAAPVVSGVVALMLEANLELTWRDVQQILARTAQVKNDGSDPSFATNQAGFTHSSRYGFGIVNANEAVTMSETWVNIGPEASHVREGRGAVQIPDNRNNSTKLSLVFDIGVNKFITETVYLYVKVNHSSRGHLKIDLISPSGMLSTMSPGQRPEAQQSGWTKFTSVRYWNEDPNGEWIISIVDTIPGTVNDCIDYNDYRFPFFEETEDANLEISCAPKHIGTLAQFCFNGTLDPNGYQATLCNETGTGDEAACSRLERFESKAYNDRTGPEACCLCGGGFSPEELPETIVEWKVVVYGRDQSTGEGFFSDSGIGNDFQLNKWGGCGNRPRGRPLLDLEYLDPEQLEALSRIHDEIGGVRGRQ